ncbi:hypothetical protein [Stackebrandtia soli]|uniref:hypothetical protein n=1 Tax=Stackebrandtia soli TaxID=1892856 RepID=UPI0039E88236
MTGPDQYGDAIERLERDVNASYSSRSDWLRSLRSDLERLSAVLPPPPPDDSPIERLTADAPRLAPAVRRLDDEHDHIRSRIDALNSRLDGPDPGDIEPPVRHLVADVHRYRRLVSRLIYEAYEVDIGGEN